MSLLKYLLVVSLLVFYGRSAFLYSQKEVRVDVWRNYSVYQYSTLGALLGGLLDGELTVDKLLKEGNLGLGTFNALYGEMVVVDGKAYRVKSIDGKAYPVRGDEKIPFAVVTDFKEDVTVKLAKPLDYRQLQQYLDTLLPSKNLFYACRVEGKCSFVKTRSVPAQKKPYPPLSEIAKIESRFTFKDVDGIMVGFRFPAFMKALNVPQYYMHFLTSGKKRGGHLLECKVSEVVIGIDYISDFDMDLPKSEDFQKMKVATDAKD